MFKDSWFSRFAAKEGIQDGELRNIVNNVLEAGTTGTKANVANINEKQLRNFKIAAKIVLSATEEQLNNVLKTGKYTEI